MSSGTQNAQNFAAVISSMVLGPSFFVYFLMFSIFCVFSMFSIFWDWGGGVFPNFGVGGVGGGLPPWALLACLGPYSLLRPYVGPTWAL